MSGDTNATRLDRVETEVSVIRSEMGGLKADVRSLGAVLSRIEAGVAKAQERTEERDERSKPNLIAVISVLITIISIIVGGAWVIGGQLARLDERSLSRDREMVRVHQDMRDQRNGGHHVDPSR